LVDDVLDLSRLESDKIELNQVPFCLKKTFNNIVQMFTPQIQQKRLSVDLCLHESDTWLKADETRLRQIVTNLFSNAIKFTSEEGSIVIVASAESFFPSDETTLSVAIRHTDIGMSKEELSRLFNKFSQANRHTATQYGGFGLGLAISKKLIEKMAGTISVKSEKFRGSEFIFTIRCQRFTEEEVLQAQ
jgi:signal transduction histidine kinase